MDEASLPPSVRRLLARAAIHDVLTDYARAVDRLDLDLLRSTFHEDALDDHGDCKGPVGEFIRWLADRHARTENSMHFIGNVHIAFFSDDLALVESYFASRRLAARPPEQHHQPGAARFDEKLGRYVDRFERRAGHWRVARRLVVFDARFTSTVQVEGRRPPYTWTRRDHSDAYAVMHGELVRSHGLPDGAGP